MASCYILHYDSWWCIKIILFLHWWNEVEWYARASVQSIVSGKLVWSIYDKWEVIHLLITYKLNNFTRFFVLLCFLVNILVFYTFSLLPLVNKFCVKKEYANSNFNCNIRKIDNMNIMLSDTSLFHWWYFMAIANDTFSYLVSLEIRSHISHIFYHYFKGELFLALNL